MNRDSNNTNNHDLANAPAATRSRRYDPRRHNSDALGTRNPVIEFIGRDRAHTLDHAMPRYAPLPVASVQAYDGAVNINTDNYSYGPFERPSNTDSLHAIPHSFSEDSQVISTAALTSCGISSLKVEKRRSSTTANDEETIEDSPGCAMDKPRNHNAKEHSPTPDEPVDLINDGAVEADHKKKHGSAIPEPQRSHSHALVLVRSPLASNENKGPDVWYLPGFTVPRMRELLEYKGLQESIVVCADTRGSDSVLRPCGGGIRKSPTSGKAPANGTKNISRDGNPSRPAAPQTSILSSRINGDKCDFSCPFPKHERRRYERVNAPCTRTPFPDFRRVKEHIQKYHSIKSGCPYCHTAWQTDQSYDREFTEHQASCSKIRAHGLYSLPESLTTLQVEALEKNYRGKRGSKAWVELYQDLFPGSFPIPSPYYDYLSITHTVDLVPNARTDREDHEQERYQVLLVQAHSPLSIVMPENQIPRLSNQVPEVHNRTTIPNGYSPRFYGQISGPSNQQDPVEGTAELGTNGFQGFSFSGDSVPHSQSIASYFSYIDMGTNEGNQCPAEGTGDSVSRTSGSPDSADSSSSSFPNNGYPPGTFQLPEQPGMATNGVLQHNFQQEFLPANLFLGPIAAQVNASEINMPVGRQPAEELFMNDFMEARQEDGFFG